jgi:hypothetical protein
MIEVECLTTAVRVVFAAASAAFSGKVGSKIARFSRTSSLSFSSYSFLVFTPSSKSFLFSAIFLSTSRVATAS